MRLFWLELQSIANDLGEFLAWVERIPDNSCAESLFAWRNRNDGISGSRFRKALK